jgi:hypothetical protein
MTRLGALAFVGLIGCTSDASVGTDVPDATTDAARDVALTDAADAADAAITTPDVTGTYLLVLKAGTNGCAFPSWNEGSVTTADAKLSQTGTAVSVEVQGVAALTFGLTVGTAVLSGKLTGKTLSAKAVGTLVGTSGSCSYTHDALLDATFDGDTVTGTVRYVRVLDGTPACASLACTTVEPFTGLRSTVVDP